MKKFQMVPFLLTDFSHFVKLYLLLTTKLSILKSPGGYEKRQKGSLIFRGLRGLPPLSPRGVNPHTLPVNPPLMLSNAYNVYIHPVPIIYIIQCQ